MVNRILSTNGQSLTEFILMLALLSVIGIFFMENMIGAHGNGGTVNSMQQSTANKIAKDPD